MVLENSLPFYLLILPLYYSPIWTSHFNSKLLNFSFLFPSPLSLSLSLFMLYSGWLFRSILPFITSL